MLEEPGLSCTSLEESVSYKHALNAQVSTLTKSLNEPDAVSPCLRKRKVDHEEVIKYYPTAAKRRFETQMLMGPGDPELAEGKFLCWCSEWISISLENWRKHILNCQHSKAKGVFSLEDMFNIAMSSSEKTIDNERQDKNVTPTYPSGIYGEEKLDPRKASKEDTGVHYDQYTTETGSNATNRGDVKNGHENGIATPYPIRKKRPNRTEEERLQEFLDDPQVKEVTPYQVLCRECNKWIKLRNNSRYCSVPWRCHKASCKWNAGSRENASAMALAGLSKNISPSHIESMQSSSSRHPNAKNPPGSVHPSLLSNPAITSSPRDSEPPLRARRLHAEGRKEILEADPNAELVEPYRVLCRLCQKWVKLRPKSTFCSAPWQSHIRRCIARCAKKGLTVPSASNLSEGKLNSRLITSGLEGSSAGGLRVDNDIMPKHRGRPRKNPAFGTTAQDVKESMESDRSYESEEL